MTLRVQRDFFINLIAAFFVEIFAFLFYLSFFDIQMANTDRLQPALLQMLMAAFDTAYFLKISSRCEEEKRYGIVLFFLFAVVLYNYCGAVTKFTLPSIDLYFATDTTERLAYALYVDVVIFFLMVLWERIHFRSRIYDERSLDLSSIIPSTAFIYTIVIFYLILQARMYYKYGTGITVAYMYKGNYNTGISTSEAFLFNIFLRILYLMVFLYLSGNKHLSILRFFPLFIVGCMQMMEFLTSGKKRAFLLFFITFVSYMVYTGQVHYRIFQVGMILSAPAYLLLLYVGTITSGRWKDSQLSGVLRYIANRTDLSDFAYNVCRDQVNPAARLMFIWEAIDMNVPNVLHFWGNKPTAMPYKAVLIRSIGLLPDHDYAETIFSVGATLVGVAGIALLPVLTLLFYETVERWILRWFSSGKMIIILIIESVVTIEYDFSMFLSNIRNMLFYIIAGGIVFSVLLQRNKGKWQVS